ncbi:hypothetical protein acsn021_38290 [Anaerocolumna cellulosilytica]|uniref:Uncharacterized protein n=1 Tax=Anaerocolumna cellulosilytica TaxID=433286 RepID=A0A6S6R9W3_9FIRM|nr:DUF6062 family protein [Anaerocolumna cellulosilytica]MBB5197843.1 hypothetical protein [Anaerocolumna cellulosilytica]BCJ96260.1 hypothetical protein acsn021_38290 [Anaerocolumna cellulosilytica]
MKEKLYTIPVNEAFAADCECPICLMKKTLEDNAIEFTMGPSYMEDDVRAETDKIGFCTHHVKKLYENQNRLGLALMLKTHMDKTIEDIEKLTKQGIKIASPSLFRKKTEDSLLKSYIDSLKNSCYICNKIENTFNRYIVTVFSLYTSDKDFVDTYKNSKGFCTTHYGLLYEEAPKYLKGDKLEEFINTLNRLYLANMKRVRDDLDWFTDKFDYRYVNEPWKNSKDALPRSMIKVNSIIE